MNAVTCLEISYFIIKKPFNMSIHLTETVQQNLGYAPLKKIDPNTQEVTVKNDSPDEHSFAQAAIPAILTAFYKYIQADEGASSFLQNRYSNEWVNHIFGDQSGAAVASISAYTHDVNADPVIMMNRIADEVVAVTKQHLPADAAVKDVKLFFSNERSNILLYLPAELNMGGLLDDEMLDDQTNKMEGPVSSLLQSIGTVFSKPATAENK